MLEQDGKSLTEILNTDRYRDSWGMTPPKHNFNAKKFQPGLHSEPTGGELTALPQNH